MVAIEAGDVVPADGRVLAAATLEVAEAALTGESLPVSMGVDAVAAPDAALGDRTDMVYMNTNVTRGTGEFVVTATGMARPRSATSRGCCRAREESKSPLTVQLEKLTKQLVTIAGLGARSGRAQHGARAELHRGLHRRGGVRHRGDPDRFRRSSPRSCPAGTCPLADATIREAELRSTETLGATSAICSDKTGTLTLNQMTAVELTIPGRMVHGVGQRLLDGGTDCHRRGRAPRLPEQFMFPLVLACDAVLTLTGKR